MKKALALVCAILFLFTSVASAESFGLDLTQLTYEELCELREAVDEEIKAKAPEKIILSENGEYVVGVDIPEGLYEVTVRRVKGNLGDCYVKLYFSQERLEAKIYDDFVFLFHSSPNSYSSTYEWGLIDGYIITVFTKALGFEVELVLVEPY